MSRNGGGGGPSADANAVASHRVRARTGEEAVVSVVSLQKVVAAGAVDPVVPRVTGEEVAVPVAEDEVGDRRRRQRSRRRCGCCRPLRPRRCCSHRRRRSRRRRRSNEAHAAPLVHRVGVRRRRRLRPSPPCRSSRTESRHPEYVLVAAEAEECVRAARRRKASFDHAGLPTIVSGPLPPRTPSTFVIRSCSSPKPLLLASVPSLRAPRRARRGCASLLIP